MLNATLKVTYLLTILLKIGNARNIDSIDEIFVSDTADIANPEETGPYLEGDINDEADTLIKFLRDGLVPDKYKWPQARIPYKIEGSFSSNELTIIFHAFSEYHSKTCVRFYKYISEKDYIAITNKPTGCWASVGRKGGRQEVNLESHKCFSNNGTTIHELMHALGFYHEQNRFERDSYVKVITENIKPNMLANFKKLSRSTALGYGVSYDYFSVMHYKATSFSKNGKPTLQALKAIPEGFKMGQRYGFSKGDVLKIEAMYRCQ